MSNRSSVSPGASNSRNPENGPPSTPPAGPRSRPTAPRRTRASPHPLLAGNRGPWGSNAIPPIRDATFREDDSRLRARTAPANHAILHTLALAVILHHPRKLPQPFHRFADARHPYADPRKPVLHAVTRSGGPHSHPDRNRTYPSLATQPDRPLARPGSAETDPSRPAPRRHRAADVRTSHNRRLERVDPRRDPDSDRITATSMGSPCLLGAHPLSSGAFACLAAASCVGGQRSEVDRCEVRRVPPCRPVWGSQRPDPPAKYRISRRPGRTAIPPSAPLSTGTDLLSASSTMFRCSSRPSFHGVQVSLHVGASGASGSRERAGLGLPISKSGSRWALRAGRWRRTNAPPRPAPVRSRHRVLHIPGRDGRAAAGLRGAPRRGRKVRPRRRRTRWSRHRPDAARRAPQSLCGNYGAAPILVSAMWLESTSGSDKPIPHLSDCFRSGLSDADTLHERPESGPLNSFRTGSQPAGRDPDAGSGPRTSPAGHCGTEDVVRPVRGGTLSPGPAEFPTDEARHHRRGTPKPSNTESTETMGTLCARACAASIRSNGSR